MSEEILVIKKKEREEALKIKIAIKNRNDARYERIIPNKDYNHLAELFFDLSRLGYNIEKAYSKYKQFSEEPDLFFLKE